MTEERIPRSAGDPEFWRRLGFESFDKYIAYLDETNSMYQPRERSVPVVGVPDLSHLPMETIEQELAQRRGFRQVGIRLRPDDYDALAAAAASHGVTPTTLARILTLRGARELAERGAG